MTNGNDFAVVDVLYFATEMILYNKFLYEVEFTIGIQRFVGFIWVALWP